MPKKDVSVVSVIVGEDIKDPDLKAIYLINEPLSYQHHEWSEVT